MCDITFYIAICMCCIIHCILELNKIHTIHTITTPLIVIFVGDEENQTKHLDVCYLFTQSTRLCVLHGIGLQGLK